MAVELPFAAASDLADWLGVTIADDDARAAAVLMAASALVQAEVGTSVVEGWDEVPDVVASVTVQVAGRVWVNPNGVVSDTKGPFTVRYADDARGLHLTETERDILSIYRTNGPKGLFTIGITRDELLLDQYVDVVGQPGEPIPFLPPDGLL